jgi:hypothetical protein
VEGIGVENNKRKGGDTKSSPADESLAEVLKEFCICYGERRTVIWEKIEQM